MEHFSGFVVLAQIPKETWVLSHCSHLSPNDANANFNPDEMNVFALVVLDIRKNS